MNAHHGEGEDKVEPFWWSLFGAGGIVAAVLVPAHILVQNLLGAAGVPAATSDYDRARKLTAHPVVRLYLLVLTTLPLFHWAHRFRYYLMDFGILGARRAIAMTVLRQRSRRRARRRPYPVASDR